jgi:ABC-type phosphate transport system substrate-binding protein
MRERWMIAIVRTATTGKWLALTCKQLLPRSRIDLLSAPLQHRSDWFGGADFRSMSRETTMCRSLHTRLAALAISIGAAVSHADTVVIVGAKSTATTMTAEEISEIYLGKSTAMKPMDSADAPIRNQFYSKVAGKDDAQVKAIWSRLVFTGKATPPKILPSSAEVVKAVAADPNAIGYIEKGAADSSVKIVYEVK